MLLTVPYGHRFGFVFIFYWPRLFAYWTRGIHTIPIVAIYGPSTSLGALGWHTYFTSPTRVAATVAFPFLHGFVFIFVSNRA